MSSPDTSHSNNGRGSDAWARSWTHVRLDRRSPGYCRVTFDHPPINTITATTVAELAELVALIEADPDLNVVVFDSANADFFLAHYDTEHEASRTAALGVGPTGMHAWLDLLVRLARSPVVSIALIRARVRGAGSEFVVACDLRFASREKTLLGDFELRGGVVPGRGPMARLCRLVGRGRALEIVLVADDLDGRRAEQYGYVNRAIPDDQLDDEVEAIASRLARLDHDAIARTKSYVDRVTPPVDGDLPPTPGDFSPVPRGAAMSMLCRSYATAGDARAAVARVLAAGVPGDAVRVVMGEPPRDARDGRHGGYGASSDPDAPVGAFAGMPHEEREAMGAYAGDGDDLRRGSYADADRDTVTTFPGGIATERVASHRALGTLLREAGVDPEAVDANVRAVHAGRVLVLVEATAAPAATGALDAT